MLFGLLSWRGVAVCVALYCGVNVVCEVVLVHELGVVEVCVVGYEEEDTRDQELVVDALALHSSQNLYRAFSGAIMCLPLAFLLRPDHGPSPPISGVPLAGEVRHWLCILELLARPICPSP
jgi:hypothetical protein